MRLKPDGVGSGAFEGRGRLPRVSVSARSFVLLALAGSSAIFLWYMVANVPVAAPRLPQGEIGRHWQEAVTALLIVGAFAVLVTATVLRRRASRFFTARDRAGGGFTWLPRALHLQRVPRRPLLVAASASVAFAVAAGLSGYPVWLIGAAILLLWIPLGAWEIMWKYEHYGLYAVFVAIVLFQLLHMAEHTVQVMQLLATNGDLERSHGVFGQLDFELVHFISVTGLWLCLGFLLHLVRGGNRWLWIAFAAACLHEVEHIYLFWLYVGHRGFYEHGGFAGIMASGGLIGSPLARAYLHFAYNLLVVVSMVVALWDESTRVCDRFLARSLSHLRKEQLVAASARLRRVGLRAGQTVPANGSGTAALMIVTKGEVEVTSEEPSGGDQSICLRKGQSIGNGSRGSVPVVAIHAARTSEVLTLDDDRTSLG